MKNDICRNQSLLRNMQNTHFERVDAQNDCWLTFYCGWNSSINCKDYTLFALESEKAFKSFIIYSSLWVLDPVTEVAHAEFTISCKLYFQHGALEKHSIFICSLKNTSLHLFYLILS